MSTSSSRAASSRAAPVAGPSSGRKRSTSNAARQAPASPASAAPAMRRSSFKWRWAKVGPEPTRPSRSTLAPSRANSEARQPSANSTAAKRPPAAASRRSVAWRSVPAPLTAVTSWARKGAWTCRSCARSSATTQAIEEMRGGACTTASPMRANREVKAFPSTSSTRSSSPQHSNARACVPSSAPARLRFSAAQTTSESSSRHAAKRRVSTEILRSASQASQRSLSLLGAEASNSWAGSSPSVSHNRRKRSPE
mmetsp:Transcript_100698/g.291026  ORF Transcript_100698/g.291026 Transcript_100698/m.291026 type:complete len:253 (+) Transcript_100698:460-1218(+)